MQDFFSFLRDNLIDHAEYLLGLFPSSPRKNAAKHITLENFLIPLLNQDFLERQLLFQMSYYAEKNKLNVYNKIALH